jgi:hypothetical protein
MLHFTENRPIEFLRTCLSKTSKYLTGGSLYSFPSSRRCLFLSRARLEPGDRAFESCPKLCLYSSAAVSIATLRNK